MAVIFPNPSLEDLNLTLHESTLISPPPSPSPKTLYLCNIDQILNYSIPTIFFFPSNPHFPPEIVTQRLRTALQRLLLTYDFIAGRLYFNPDLGRLEILCNSAGAGFVVASSHSTLADLGDLVCPNPQFQQLAPQTINLKDRRDDDQPLFILQVTSFKCGGFAVGMSMNHILLDGISAKEFKQNLASQAFEDERPLAVIPYLNRGLLTARSPPQVEFPHPEFFKPDRPPNSSGPPVFDCKREELEFRVFRLTPADITFLKDKATASASDTKIKISSFSAVVALIWRCKALSLCGDPDRSRVSRLLNVVDIRRRLKPELPEGYCGNAVLVAQSAAECGEMEGEFGKVAEKVGKGPGVIGDEYVRSAIDWLEVNKGLPNGEYMVSSWLRLGFEEVEFPWGKAEHCGPVVNHRKDICWVFPTPGGIINALVALPPPEMARFQPHFLQFFNSHNQ